MRGQELAFLPISDPGIVLSVGWVFFAFNDVCDTYALCAVTPHFDALQTHLAPKTSGPTAAASVDGALLRGRVGGCARSAELFAFAGPALGVDRGVGPCVGLGRDGLAVFRPAWQSGLSEGCTPFLYLFGGE